MACFESCVDEGTLVRVIPLRDDGSNSMIMDIANLNASDNRCYDPYYTRCNVCPGSACSRGDGSCHLNKDTSALFSKDSSQGTVKKKQTCCQWLKSLIGLGGSKPIKEDGSVVKSKRDLKTETQYVSACTSSAPASMTNLKSNCQPSVRSSSKTCVCPAPATSKSCPKCVSPCPSFGCCSSKGGASCITCCTPTCPCPPIVNLRRSCNPCSLSRVSVPKMNPCTGTNTCTGYCCSSGCPICKPWMCRPSSCAPLPSICTPTSSVHRFGYGRSGGYCSPTGDTLCNLLLNHHYSYSKRSGVGFERTPYMRKHCGGFRNNAHGYY